jgi:hypothetical protein
VGDDATLMLVFFLFLFGFPGVDRKAIVEANGAIATLLRVLHDTYEKTDADPDQQQKSVELLLSTLLNTLSECRPTDEERKMFFAFGLKGSVLKTSIQSPAIRIVASEVLTKFSGEY